MDVGNGGTIGYSLKKVDQITLVDISSEILKNPKIVVNGKYQKIKNINYKTIVANVTNLPFNKNEFDAVVMISTLHHLSESSIKLTKKNMNRAILEIKKVIKPNGYFILSECHPNLILKPIQDLFYIISYPILSIFGKPQPFFLSKKETTKLLEKHGFKIVKQSDIPSGAKVYVPLFPSISPPGWFWDKLIESRIYIAKKVLSKRY